MSPWRRSSATRAASRATSSAAAARSCSRSASRSSSTPSSIAAASASARCACSRWRCASASMRSCSRTAQALLELVELGLLGERLLGRLLGVGERALGGPQLQLDLGGALRVLGDDSVHLGEHGERSFLSGGEDPLRHVHVFGGIDREADIGQPVVVEDVLAGGTRPTGRGRSRWSPGSRVGRRRRRGAGPGWPPPCRRCALRRR